MKQLFFIIILSLSYSTILCQAGQTVTGNGETSWSIHRQFILVPSVSKESTYDSASLRDIKGSPYQNENFQTGAIYYDGKLIQDNVLLRYNIFADQFEMKEELYSENMTAIAYDPSISLKLEGQTYVYLPILEQEIEKGSYYKVVTKNLSYNLYKKTSVTYAPKVFATTSFKKNVPASFNQTETYFLRSKDGSFTELPTNKNKLVKALSPKSNEIKKFIKTNNIKIDDEKSLARIIRYYESIM